VSRNFFAAKHLF